MAKRITSLLMIAVILLCCGSCSGIKLTKFVDVTEETAVPPKIVFLGDSIAAGFGLEGYTASDLYNCRSYANIIGEMYGKELPEECTGVMVNKAVSGATSSDLLESIKNGDLDDALADSDAVVVSIGGNDLLFVLLGIVRDTGYNYESGKMDFSETDILNAALDLLTLDGDIDKALEGFRTNLKEIAAGLSEKTDGKIFIQTLYNPLEYFKKIKVLVNFSDDKIDTFNKIVEECAYDGETQLYTTVDVAGAFDGRCKDLTNISSIDIHPNAAGHEVIAGKVDSAVRKYTYSYTKTVEVTDEDAVRRLVLICAAAGIAVIAVITVVIVVLVRKSRNKSR